MLLCPICRRPLDQASDPAVATCESGHCFNRAKEGYLNLLHSSKKGDSMGDPKAAARSRRDFLNKGYYAPLRDALVAAVRSLAAERPDDLLPLLDICCGEGYYTSALGQVVGEDAYGFDLSKEMVRLAARRGNATYFVANMKSVPVPDASFSVATCLFAPFLEDEVVRVVRPGGTLLTVVPGARHLFGLKEVLYDTPYLNDEALPHAGALELVGTQKVEASVELASPQDIEAVFQMTPYYYRTREQDRARLAALETLATPLEFVIARYRRP